METLAPAVEVTPDTLRNDIANALQLLLTSNIVVDLSSAPALDAVQRRLESALAKLDGELPVTATGTPDQPRRIRLANGFHIGDYGDPWLMVSAYGDHVNVGFSIPRADCARLAAFARGEEV